MYRPKNPVYLQIYVQRLFRTTIPNCQPTNPSARKLIKSTEFMDSFAKEFKASTHPHDAKAWDKPR